MLKQHTVSQVLGSKTGPTSAACAAVGRRHGRLNVWYVKVVGSAACLENTAATPAKSIILARGPINARCYPLFQRMIPADIIYKYEVVVVVGKKKGDFFHHNTYHRGPPPRVDKNGVVYIVVVVVMWVGRGGVYAGGQTKGGHHKWRVILTKLIWLPNRIIIGGSFFLNMLICD